MSSLANVKETISAELLKLKEKYSNLSSSYREHMKELHHPWIITARLLQQGHLRVKVNQSQIKDLDAMAYHAMHVLFEWIFVKEMYEFFASIVYSLFFIAKKSVILYST